MDCCITTSVFADSCLRVQWSQGLFSSGFSPTLWMTARVAVDVATVAAPCFFLLRHLPNAQQPSAHSRRGSGESREPRHSGHPHRRAMKTIRTRYGPGVNIGRQTGANRDKVLSARPCTRLKLRRASPASAWDHRLRSNVRRLATLTSQLPTALGSYVLGTLCARAKYGYMDESIAPG